MVADEAMQSALDRFEVCRPGIVSCVRNSAIVGADRQIQIAASFIEQQRHPDGDETCRHPRVEVVGVVQLDVYGSRRGQLAQAVPGELG